MPLPSRGERVGGPVTCDGRAHERIGNTFQVNYLLPLMAMGIIERAIPDKLKSRLQKCRLTEAGKRVLEKRK